MRYHVLATDYDGTIARDERVAPEVVEALKRLKASGRKLILVTGREIDQLKAIFPEHTLFDRVVAENGALIYRPDTMEERLLGERPPEAFIQELKKKGVPISVGRVIVATWEPHQAVVLDAIKTTGLEYQVIFNKGAVMVLPPGINKAKGLHEALKDLCMAEHNTVAVGDAENDNSMLNSAECAVAVGNALPQVQAIADWTTGKRQGDGVMELIEALIKSDLLELDRQLTRHHLELGRFPDDTVFAISPYGQNILLAGTSGSGKTTFTAALLEKLTAKTYQFCLIDPEGDYLDLPGVLSIGDSTQPPVIEHVIKLLKQANESAVVCLLAIPLKDRPDYFKKLLHAVLELRWDTGHPHMIIMDEAHHMVPKEHEESFFNFPADFHNFLVITTKPDLICHSFLKRINIAMTIGELPDQAMSSFADLTGRNIAIPENVVFNIGEILVWQKGGNDARLFKSDMPIQFLFRHKRKYATGDMAENSFIFKGPDHKLNLKANNLLTFIQMAEGIDDETWLYYLQRRDYSKWFRNSVKDEGLARLAEKIEDTEHNANLSRKAIFQLINERYTAPA
jgi:hydroxymethylpyrimidine pyrophosphatase-like HAD family hydrolase/GTPase SAR1 family protein